MNMNDFLKLIRSKNEKWFSKTIGKPNDNPVTVRVMENFMAPFHVHEKRDEMFFVLSGDFFIDTKEGSIHLKKGQSYTVPAGIKHRARTQERVELVVVGGQ